MTVEEHDADAMFTAAGRAADPSNWPRGRGLHACPPAAVVTAYLRAGRDWSRVHAGDSGTVWVDPPPPSPR
jgi:hypothetical protein